MENTKIFLMFSIIGQMTLMHFKMSEMNYQLERIAYNTSRIRNEK